MKQYIELCIVCEGEEQADIATAFLADYPFESFDTEPTNDGVTLKAYILAEVWEEHRAEALSSIADYGTLLSESIIEDENWNAQWENDGFKRVEIEGVMVIRAPHHEPAEEGIIDIVVAPQMSFGSGHHQTTRMMCRLIHALQPTGRILDVGCGTGVLSIAAVRCGAEHADAIDIDIWSVESAKEYAKLHVESVFAAAGCEVVHSDGYPGWAPNPQSTLLECTKEAYKKLFGSEPKVRAIHAGLECGLFLEKYPHLEMVSFGPTLRGVHSPDERLEIATVDKFWKLLVEVVATIQ